MTVSVHDQTDTCPGSDGDHPLAGHPSEAFARWRPLHPAPAPARHGARPGVRSRRARGGDEEDRKCPEPDLNRHAREGAARFKLAVSAFHHLGRPWAPHRSPEPIGRRLTNRARADRCCLILLASEGASARGTGHPHLPIALRAGAGAVCGMTEFHRPNKDAPPVLARPAPRGAPSSSGMTRRPPVHPQSAPGTGTAMDYTAPDGRDDGRVLRTPVTPSGASFS